jgi:hyperosmotically inducible periplasmic protein
MENIMSKRLLLVLFTLAGGCLLLMAAAVEAERGGVIYLAADSALENTERNVRDQDNATLTPEDQKETEGDIKITAAIRQTVVKNESLSVNAQNVKIITRNGVVTLRGPVESAAENMKLQDIAKQTPGVMQVNNQLEIKAP